jgi:ERCC4-related helicase
VQHTDKQHPHLHLVYNRVGNNGQTITDRYQKVVNAKVCKEITLKYGYHLAEGKAQVNRQRLKGSDQIKYEMYDAIKAVAKVAQNWQQLETALLKQGIQTHYKYLNETDNVQGISFSKGTTKFKGCEIDRSLSYGKLDQLIELNKKQAQRQAIASINDNTFLLSNSFSDKHGASLLGKLLEPDHDHYAQTPFELLRTKRKLKKGRRI